MARRDSTAACERHHKRISRLRHTVDRLREVAGLYSAEFPRVVRMEVETIQRMLARVSNTLGDEVPRVDIEQAERDIDTCGKRVCTLIQAVTKEATHHYED